MHASNTVQNAYLAQDTDENRQKMPEIPANEVTTSTVGHPLIRPKLVEPKPLLISVLARSPRTGPVTPAKATRQERQAREARPRRKHGPQESAMLSDT